MEETNIIILLMGVFVLLMVVVMTVSMTETDIHSSALQPFFGDGSYGDYQVNVNTSLTSVNYYQNLRITNRSFFNTAGYPVFVNGTLTIDEGALIGSKGNKAASASSAGAALTGTYYIGSVAGVTAPAVSGAAECAMEGNGANGAASTNGATLSVATLGRGAGSASGAKGGNCDIWTGGNGGLGAAMGGTVTDVGKWGVRHYFSILTGKYNTASAFAGFGGASGSASGANGGSGACCETYSGCTPGTGGRGGASGGNAQHVGIFARWIKGTGTIISMGGDGSMATTPIPASGSGDCGGGGGASGGSGGNGDYIFVVYEKAGDDGNTVTWKYNVSGGSGGIGTEGSTGRGIGEKGANGRNGTDGNPGVVIVLSPNDITGD